MKTPTTRRRRIIRALTPKRVKRMQAKWRRRTNRITKARDKVRGIWHGDVVINGRRKQRGKVKVPAQRKAAEVAQPRRKKVKPKTVELPTQPQCDGTCTNSDMEPDMARARGLCDMCCGRKELVTNFGGKHVHTACPECDSSGLASVQARRKGHISHHPDSADETRDKPSRKEAGRTASVWFMLGSVCFAVATVFGLGVPALIAGMACMVVGGASYLHERKHGTSDHGPRSGREAAKKAARESGCTAACMWSPKPVETCHCPCGGSSHGMAHKRKKAAA